MRQSCWQHFQLVLLVCALLYSHTMMPAEGRYPSSLKMAARSGNDTAACVRTELCGQAADERPRAEPDRPAQSRSAAHRA